MPENLRDHFVTYLKDVGSARIKHRLDPIAQSIDEYRGINYHKLREIRGCGKIVIEEIIFHLHEFQEKYQEDIISSECMEDFWETLQIKGSDRLIKHTDSMFKIIRIIGGVYIGSEKRFKLNKNLLRELDSLWHMTVHDDDENPVPSLDLSKKQIDNFFEYLHDMAPSLLQPKLKKIRNVCDQRTSLDIYIHDVDYLGKRKFLYYEKLKKEYLEEYPDFNYSRKDYNSENTLLLLSFFDSDNFEDNINEWINNSLLKFDEIRVIMTAVANHLLSRLNLSSNVHYFDDKYSSKVYIFCRFWLDTNHANYFLYKFFFNSGLKGLTKERKRQYFVKEYPRHKFNTDLVVFENTGIHEEDIKGRSFIGLRYYCVNDFLFIVRQGLDFNGFSLPLQLPYNVAVKFASIHKLVVLDRFDFTLLTKQSLKRQTLKMIIEKFVAVNEHDHITSAHISEELEKYGFKYPSNYIPNLVLRSNYNIRQKLDWSWVIRDGSFDNDPPNCVDYTDFFRSRIEEGKSLHESLIELRRYYPDYTVKRALSLLAAKKENPIYHLVWNKMLLGHWFDSQRERKHFFMQIKYPKSFINKDVVWPGILSLYYSVPKLTEYRGRYCWEFTLESELICRDLIDYISAITYYPNALFKINEKTLNIDGEEVDIH